MRPEVRTNLKSKARPKVLLLFETLSAATVYFHRQTFASWKYAIEWRNVFVFLVIPVMPSPSKFRTSAEWGNEFLSVPDAAEKFDLSENYILKLRRANPEIGRMIDKRWHISHKLLSKLLATKSNQYRSWRRELSSQRKLELMERSGAVRKARYAITVDPAPLLSHRSELPATNVLGRTRLLRSTPISYVLLCVSVCLFLTLISLALPSFTRPNDTERSALFPLPLAGYMLTYNRNED